MPPLKIVVISSVVSIIIMAAAFQCIVSPIVKKNHVLDKKEKLLTMVQKKSALIVEATERYEKYGLLLNDNIKITGSFAFLQKQLKASELFVESLKINKADDYDEINIITKGEYRHLLRFLQLLAERPNGMQVTALSLKQNHMMITIQIEKKEKKAMIRAHRHRESDILGHVQQELVFVKSPILFIARHALPQNVQSPFIARTSPAPASNTLQSLARYHWHCVGDVHQAGRLLGIFLEAEGESQYFGLGLSWQDSDWIVVDISSSVVSFKRENSPERWQLIYA